MKTLDECKKEICARFAHPDWKSIIESCRSKNDDVFNHIVDSLCELYADQQYQQGAVDAQDDAAKYIKSMYHEN